MVIAASLPRGAPLSGPLDGRGEPRHLYPSHLPESLIASRREILRNLTALVAPAAQVRTPSNWTVMRLRRARGTTWQSSWHSSG